MRGLEDAGKRGGWLPSLSRALAPNFLDFLERQCCTRSGRLQLRRHGSQHSRPQRPHRHRFTISQQPASSTSLSLLFAPSDPRVAKQAYSTLYGTAKVSRTPSRPQRPQRATFISTWTSFLPPPRFRPNSGWFPAPSLTRRSTVVGRNSSAQARWDLPCSPFGQDAP